ncbi:PREDICTED: nijmegen breakage syndrome 1 protein [Lupinus angustifolius]|uniref:nijmegen breakage syndrome 1 protein n=1 Tax=Lupinus angustifolius TaxID=3871 RepID=UPI00092F2AEB|nr:PREDICTED: nijmegen breakage syndrome 1 protein [Lupinus angustifolius]XP_019456825.1 PREDICTED: nijmegen breakage syndrome 1 protein [Lupinus angustifolius]XP_019456826.1 PREDICTED: nijmegen breakage syndrome 1 protein [Lupinus angustifolius]
MVWGLFPFDPLTGEDSYYIFKTGTYKVGRKGCDVIVTKDKGVSRVHAEIVINAMNLSNPLRSRRSHLSPSILIRDCSKYGTFITKNAGLKQKLHELPNKETSLEDGDVVSFGAGSATYKFCHVPLIFFICSLDKVDQALEEKISSIGAGITHTLGEECTHMLLDQFMPLKKDLIDAVVAKKCCVLKTWLEFFAEKNIGTEIPSHHSYVPTVSVEGKSIKVADPKTRENCLKGCTFLLELLHLYKFKDQLKSSLEVAGAKTVSVEEFCSNSQGSDYGDDNRVVYVIPGGPACKSDHFNKLSSLLRVNEMDIIFAVVSGQLDMSILKSPCVLVSSSCSTDETVVADSDTEVETATSARASETLFTTHNLKFAKRKDLDDDSGSLDIRKNERVEASSGDVSTKLHEIKYAKMETSLDGVSVKSDTNVTSIRDSGVDIKVMKDKVDDHESGNSDIIYSQNLVVRDTNVDTNRSTVPNSSIPNFKRFRKGQTQSGNSFDNLVPYAKYPYKDSDYGNDEDIIESVKEEKRRKQREAVAEDLFNNEKARRRGTGGSLRGILLS